MPLLEDVSTDEFNLYMEKLFAVADKNGDGVLQPEEFERLLSLSGFNLESETVRALMDAADVNEDGVVDWKEYLPSMKAIVDDVAKAATTAQGPHQRRVTLLRSSYEEVNHTIQGISQTESQVGTDRSTEVLYHVHLMIALTPAPWVGDHPPQEQHPVDMSSLSRYIVQKKAKKKHDGTVDDSAASYVESAQTLISIPDPIDPRNQWATDKAKQDSFQPDHRTKWR